MGNVLFEIEEKIFDSRVIYDFAQYNGIVDLQISAPILYCTKCS